MKWFKEGDANTKFFPSMINAKRRRLNIKKIRNAENTWVEGNEEVAKEALAFFEEQFTE